MLLAGTAPEQLFGCFGTDWGRRGHANLESSRSLVSLRKSTIMGPHPVSCCFAPWPEGCQSVASLVAYMSWPWGSALRAWVPGLRAASLVRTVAYEGTLPLCRFLSCPSVSLLYCLGSSFFFLMKTLNVNSLFLKQTATCSTSSTILWY